MDTVSLLVYRRARAAGPWIPLVALASIGLIFFGLVGQGLAMDLPQSSTDPLLAPFRWMAVSSHIG